MPKVAHVCIVLYCLVEMLSALSPAHLHLVARLGRINSRTGLRLRGGDGETQADAKTNEAGEKLNEEKEEDSDKKQQKLQQMLWEGASEGDTMLVMQAYRSGANLLQKNEEGLNALHLACASGHLEVVQSILEECKDLSCTAGDGSTPLHLSVYYGFREIAQFLIENSADLSAVDHEGSTPLHNAAYRGLPEIITLLVEKGADVNAQQMVDNCTALHLAAGQGHDQALARLIQLGADLSMKAQGSKTAMDMAREKQHKRCVVILDLARTQGKVDMEQVQMVEKAAEFIASGLIQKVRKDSLVQNQLKNLSSYPSMVTWASLRTRKVPSSTTSTSKTAKKAGLKGSSKTKKGLSLKHKTQSIGQVGLKSWTLNKLDTNPRLKRVASIAFDVVSVMVVYLVMHLLRFGQTSEWLKRFMSSLFLRK